MYWLDVLPNLEMRWPKTYRREIVVDRILSPNFSPRHCLVLLAGEYQGSFISGECTMSKRVRWGWDSGGVVVAGRWRHRPGPFPWQQCYPSPSSSPSSSPVDSILLSFIYTSSSRSALRLAMLASMAASNKSTSSSSLTYSFSSSL